MKILIEMAEEKYEWIKKNNSHADPNSIVGAVAYGVPYEEKAQGEWVVIHTATGETKCKCNQCQHYIKIGNDKNYCPNCGIKMKVI